MPKHYIQEIENLSEQEWEEIIGIFKKGHRPSKYLKVSEKLKLSKNQPSTERNLADGVVVDWSYMNATLLRHGSKFRIHHTGRGLSFGVIK